MKIQSLFKSMLVMASAALVSVGVMAQEPLQFAVISDVHFDDGTGGGANVRTPIALQNISDHGDLDAIAVCGDLSNSGTRADFEQFRDCFLNDENYFCPNIFELILMMGNHDNYADGAAAFQDVMSVFNGGQPYPLDTYRVIKGYPFISISMRNSSASDWNNNSAGLSAYPRAATDFLREAMAEAAEECPGKPIFVFTHCSPRYTCYSSWYELEGTDWSMNMLNPILNQYPQAVVFAGHSHYPIGDPRSIHQGVNPNSSRQNYYTVLNTGSTTYSEISNPFVDEGIHPAGYKDVNEGYIVRELKNGDIEIVRLDTRRNIEIDPEHRWVLKAPFDGSQFCYGDLRDADDNPLGVTLRNGLPAPTFGDAKLEVKASAFNATITIPQATDETCVFCYHVKVSTEGATVKEASVFSQFYLNTDMPSSVTCKVYNLKPGRTYDVEVTALDSYENASAPITTSFVTNGSSDPEDAVPAAIGRWEFNDPENPMACTEGTLEMQPVICRGGMSPQETIADAGIEWCEGVEEGDGALLLPATAGFYIPMELEEEMKTFTIQWDVNLSSADSYNAFLQTTVSNTNDADLFTHNGQIGIGANGYYGSVSGNTWTRIIFINNDGKVTVFIDGELVFENLELNRWNIQPDGVLFFCDEDGERIPTKVTNVVFWDVALTENQVFTIGLLGTSDYLDIMSSDVKISGNDLTFNVKVKSSVPVRFELPEWIEAIDVAPVIGTKEYAFRCKPMDEAGVREADIVVTSSYGLSATVHVTQESFGGQLPDPLFVWTFDNASDLTSGTGDAILAPVYFGDYPDGIPTQADTPDEAGIVPAEGPVAGNGAVYVPKNSGFKVTLPFDGPIRSYTLLYDIKPEVLESYNSLLQTNENNTEDGDLFINGSSVGIRRSGLNYNGLLLPDQWHRIVFVVKECYVYLYIDGELVGQSTDSNDQWGLATRNFYFFIDEDGEMQANYVAELRYYDRPLSADLVAMLGDLGAEADVDEAPEADEIFTFDSTDIDEVLVGTGRADLIPARQSDDPDMKVPEEVETIDEAGIGQVAGPKEGNLAINVPPYSYLLFMPKRGNDPIVSYTILMDIRPDQLRGYQALFQHAVDNGRDGTLFINGSSVGINTAGLGYAGQLKENTWHRLVVVVEDSAIRLYLDGARVSASTSAGPWAIDRYMYLFLDNDGEEGSINLAEFRYWDAVLTDAQVRSLGGVDVDTRIVPVTDQQPAADARIYDLMGRPVATDRPLPAGLYIQQGKKFLVR